MQQENRRAQARLFFFGRTAVAGATKVRFVTFFMEISV
jgi:hypothetical protein